MPGRYAAVGDLHAGMDDAVYDVSSLLEGADRDEREGGHSPGSEEHGGDGGDEQQFDDARFRQGNIGGHDLAHARAGRCLDART